MSAIDPEKLASDFVPFPKIARLSRDVIVTEKIDGSNAQVFIEPFCNPNYEGPNGPYNQQPDGSGWYSELSGTIHAKLAGVVYTLKPGSRNQWLMPGKLDNFGFAGWVRDNAADLVTLGPGRHFGEWWGSGIQRGYGLPKGEKRFSLFNTTRWADDATRPACCHVVPTLKIVDGLEHLDAPGIMDDLSYVGSLAAPGFMKPEGIVIFHAHGNVLFKKTFEKDDAGKERGA